MTARGAACHCGAVTLSCEGEPRKVSMCHCRDCQRRTGSMFSVAVFYPRDCVRINGVTSRYVRDSASGFPVAFHFCPACGANLFWEPHRLPNLMGIAIGAFADPDFPPPEQSVWTRDKHRWLALPDDLPAFDRNPPPRG